ncbi:MAG: CPBP family intramembrane metalloprotease [Candidatus Izimaplasma sp.]|nr:CPBP family intramembrane metalloprotease [Candidatus Izimaplasma bacterium]
MVTIKDYKIIGIYVGMLVLLIGFQAYFIFIQNWDINDTTYLIRLNSVSNLFYYGGMLLLFVGLFFSYWKNEWVKFIENKTQVFLFIVIGFGAMIGASTIAGLIMYGLDVTEESINQAQLQMLLTEGTRFDQIALVIFAVILAPPVEELVFRKASFELLERFNLHNPIVLIIFTGVIFGFIHVASDDFLQIISYALLGVVLGGLYFYSDRKIIIPIIVHMGFNLMVTITMFVGL